MPTEENNPNDLNSRLDPPGFSTMDLDAAPKTPPKPSPKAPDEVNEGPGTLPLRGAAGSTGTEMKPDVPAVPPDVHGKAQSGLHPKAAPSAPTPPRSQKVIIKAEADKPIRRGKRLMPAVTGLVQTLIGLLLIGLLLASVAPIMAEYEGPVGEMGVSIRDWVRPYALDLCEAAPISGCFGYDEPAPIPTIEPESS